MPSAVAAKIIAPSTALPPPLGRLDAVDQWMWSRVSSTYPTVAMASTMVSQVCSLMIASKPLIPATTITAATTTNATTLTGVPCAQPSRSNTVVTASVDKETRMISQPTSRTYDTSEGSALPRTPN